MLFRGVKSGLSGTHTMKRLIATTTIVVAISIFLGPAVKAEKLVIEVPGFATLEYPKLIKLTMRKCQDVPIGYEISGNLNRDGAALLIQIGNVKKKKVAGYAAWFGNIPGANAVLPMPAIGGLKLKVCQKDWALNKQNFIGVKPGIYDLYIAYGNYEIDGTVQKQVLIKKIKFIK
jgi:hypothetical protein